MSVSHTICGFKNCWFISLILSSALFPLQIFLFCTYRVLYILYMMSSLGSDKARGPREKALPTATHTSQPQKQLQVSNVKKQHQYALNYSWQHNHRAHIIQGPSWSLNFFFLSQSHSTLTFKSNNWRHLLSN